MQFQLSEKDLLQIQRLLLFSANQIHLKERKIFETTVKHENIPHDVWTPYIYIYHPIYIVYVSYIYQYIYIYTRFMRYAIFAMWNLWVKE